MQWRDKIDRMLEHAGEPMDFFLGVLVGVIVSGFILSRLLL